MIGTSPHPGSSRNAPEDLRRSILLVKHGKMCKAKVVRLDVSIEIQMRR